MAAGGSKPMMASEVMDFPEPDSPTKPSTSPAAMENERLRTAAAGTAALAAWSDGWSYGWSYGRVDESACPAPDCRNSMVRSRTSSSGLTKAMVPAPRLLFWPRFRRHQPGNPVIHNQLSVVLSGMFEQPPCHIGDSHLLMRERIDDQIAHPLVALLLDRSRAVGKRFLHKLDHRRFRFVLVALGIFFGWRLQPHRRVRKEIIRIRRVQQLLGKATLGGHRLEVVLVLGEILRHRDQLAANIVPVLQQNLGRPSRRLRRSIFLHRVLRDCKRRKNPHGKNHTKDSFFHFVIPL